ncbi:TPA: YgiT-type zinc finger protein, partial [Legionella pneumophila subsp. pneumophila]|nr:YgiT-type zinc finger protein [Legionella pneumophila subsp. pneumophila]
VQLSFKLMKMANYLFHLRRHKMAKKRCMVCGENTCEYKIKEIPFTYKGETTFIKQPGEWCET